MCSGAAAKRVCVKHTRRKGPVRVPGRFARKARPQGLSPVDQCVQSPADPPASVYSRSFIGSRAAIINHMAETTQEQNHLQSQQFHLERADNLYVPGSESEYPSRLNNGTTVLFCAARPLTRVSRFSVWRRCRGGPVPRRCGLITVAPSGARGR